MDNENNGNVNYLERVKGRLEKMQSNHGGVSFFGLLFITFMVLKLTNVINWSWWWVSAPLWMPIAIVLGIAFIAIIVVLIAACCGKGGE